MTSLSRQVRILAVSLACLASCAAVGAADPPRWATGSDLQRQLATPLSISWDNTPLERALTSLSQAQRIAIVRDRRIDPGQPLKLAIDDEPLSQALEKIARHLRIGYCQFGPVAYFGPPATAKRLRTLAALRLEDARKLPAPTLRKLLTMKNSQWEKLTEPRELALRLAGETGAKLVGAERIAHDLWPAADLPPLSWIDRLTLLAAQFDLTFRFADAGRGVELVAVPERVVLSRTYLGGGDALALARRWTQELPDAKIAATGNRIRVDAPLEDHEHLEARLRGQPTRRTTVTAGERAYQLSVEKAALDKVVAQLGKQLDLDFQWDRPAIDAAGIAVDQLVSVKISQASLDELLAAVLAGTGLASERTGRTVTIRPK
ncbi:MAG: STN domain-containing protein [Pirellulales bacterium]